MIRPTGARAAALAVVVVCWACSACSRSSEPRGAAATPAPGASTAPPGTAIAAPATSPTEAPPSPSPAGTPAPSGGAPGAPTAAATPPSTPPPAAGPIPLPVTSAVARVGDASAPLSFNETTVVDPAARLHVETGVALNDARLSLMDGDDAIVAASESHEIGATWTRFTLVPDAPLRPGSKYVLRLDGAAEREAHDAEGRAYQVATWPLKVAGEPPPPAARPAKAPAHASPKHASPKHAKKRRR